MAAGDLILLTGGTGHVGFRTLRYALEHGYNVRAAVRSEAKGKNIRNNPALASIDNLDSKLTFVVVPDFVQPGAFDEAAKGVKYIVHIASPIPTGSYDQEKAEEQFLKPAAQGTVGLLESAKKAGSVKRVVVTSSAVALVTVAVLTGQEKPTRPINSEDRGPEIPPPYPVDEIAYAAAKILALKRGEEYVQKEKPGFDIIHIAPTYVGGRDDMTKTVADFKSGTNRYFMAPALEDADAGPRPFAVVHIDDVAKSHIESLNESVAGNQLFILSSDGTVGEWDDAKDIVKKHFPEAVKKGLLPDTVSVGGANLAVDNSKTEKTFGKLKPYEDMVTSVVGHYLEVLEKEKA